jgi:hypothetical protein
VEPAAGKRIARGTTCGTAFASPKMVGPLPQTDTKGAIGNALRISSEQRSTLLTYSERIASLAVRERSQEFVTLGLVALGVDGWRADWWGNALIVSLHFDATQTIGASPEAIFESAARLLPEKPAHALRSFLRRSDDDKSLGATGYEVGNDDDGFRYRRTW